MGEKEERWEVSVVLMFVLPGKWQAREGAGQPQNDGRHDVTTTQCTSAE